jgi:hypothetical protein
MKNALFLAIAAMFFSVALRAQSTVDSIEAKYKLLPMPEALTTEKIFPVIGTYQLNGNASGTVTITLDSTSKGLIWVSGLPEGKFKAYLKQSPATYRIVPQTTDLGKKIPEGTLVFNPDSKVLNISLGAPFNDANPTAIFPADVTASTSSSANTSLSADNSTEAAANSGKEVTVKTKTASSKTKTKTHLIFYTGTKTEQTMTSANPVQ